MYIFTEQEIRTALQLNTEVTEQVKSGFLALARGLVVTPPIMRVDITDANGELDVKTAYVKGLGQFAVKMSSGFFHNPAKGLPSGSGMMVLFSAVSGIPEAVFLDNGYMTDVRTAAAGAVAAQYLAPNNCRIVGVIGSGMQAQYQLQALRLVRSFDSVLVYSRNPANARRFAERMTKQLQLPVQAARTPQELVQQSETVLTATPSKVPLIEASWLHKGMHITAVGSDAEGKQELDRAVLAAADVFVCDLKSQSEVLGELHHAVKSGPLPKGFTVTEIGDMVSGKKPGRSHSEEITICDLTGTGVQDTMVAIYAYELLRSQGAGTEF
ncbi:cyclodeaminase [Alicyclobacillus sp. SO9]|uniref:cyclodeaminase n=1 Tax=Alicyclobacillus sp. SO9 TaxID=2665646 RepID=UPI0018E78F9D|nr:cyclodeaminase [Alicyclobacillus sp. SO9]QQE79037.1 cyclodeaminase [Alicyclobacillus sp. SO9]